MFTLLLSLVCPSSHVWGADLRISSSRGQDNIEIQRSPLPDCPNGDVVVGTFPFGNQSFRDKYNIAVYGPEMMTLDQIKRKIEAKGLRPVALINGGYFLNSVPVSYFKSSFNRNEHPQNSARSPRSCMVHYGAEGRFNLLQSTETNYNHFVNSEQTEVYCSGPQLVAGGQNVTTRQICAEQFSPECRSDHSDPGLEFQRSYPRTASCFTRDGSYKIFAFSSPTKKCGVKGVEMAAYLLRQGCVDGVNHDGGGSAKLFLTNGSELVIRRTVEDRAVPVWIAVLRK